MISLTVGCSNTSLNRDALNKKQTWRDRVTVVKSSHTSPTVADDKVNSNNELGFVPDDLDHESRKNSPQKEQDAFEEAFSVVSEKPPFDSSKPFEVVQADTPKHDANCNLNELSNEKESKSIYGKWISTGMKKEVLTICPDGSIREIANFRFEFVNSVNPKQIYILSKDGDARFPFAIYMIKGDYLILGSARMYERSIRGINLGGIERSEFPRDFKGEVFEFKRAPQTHR